MNTDSIEPLVSIIIPSYNAEKYIGEMIESLQSQTIDSWEALITDDCSLDATREIVARYARSDSRIHMFTLERNMGAAAARNNSLKYARGRYVAYLDADDVWYPKKIETQIAFMQEKDAVFSCASYEVIDDEGAPLGKTVQMLEKCNYLGFLTHNLLQTVGIMVDTRQVDRNLLVMPSLRRRQDAATWLQILKAGYVCYGIPLVLCGYRRVPGSLSSNKTKAVKGVWHLYRQIERLSLPFSVYCFARYAILAIWKRIYC